MTKRLVPIVYGVLFIACLISPFYLDWRLILLGIVLLHLQFAIFGGCILTNLEFGKYDKIFMHEVLARVGISVNVKVMKILMRFILPVLMTAVIYQTQ